MHETVQSTVQCCKKKKEPISMLSLYHMTAKFNSFVTTKYVSVYIHDLNNTMFTKQRHINLNSCKQKHITHVMF